MMSTGDRKTENAGSNASASPKPDLFYGELLGEKIIGRGDRVVIRRYMPSDREAVLELNRKALGAVPGYSKIKRPACFDDDILDIDGHYMKGRNDFIVAELGGRIVGCASLREVPDKGTNVVEFMRVRVDPLYFRNGIGEELTSVRYELARKRGFEEAYMDTYAIQEASIKLHVLDGWKLTEVLEPAWATDADTKVFCYRKKL